MKSLLGKHLEYIYKQWVNYLNSQSLHKPNLTEILDRIEILYVVQYVYYLCIEILEQKYYTYYYTYDIYTDILYVYTHIYIHNRKIIETWAKDLNK